MFTDLGPKTPVIFQVSDWDFAPSTQGRGSYFGGVRPGDHREMVDCLKIANFLMIGAGFFYRKFAPLGVRCHGQEGGWGGYF